MILDFYRLPEQPFGVTPDPRFLFLSDTHKQALTALLNGIEQQRGFIMFVAEPGLGKTTLLARVVNQLRGQACTVLLLHKATEPPEMLKAMLAELGISTTGEGILEMQSKLEQALLELSRAAWRFVLVVDEAQDLSDASLELLRTLSNIETPTEKLVQIVLCGQPALAGRLSTPGLVQLRQRIAVGVRLKRLLPLEIEQYIDSRLKTAGYLSKVPLFTQEALTLLIEFSQGIPRNVNNLCFNALAAGYAQKRKTIHGAIVRAAAADLNFGSWQDEAIALARSENPVPAAPVESVAAPSLAHRIPKLALVATVLLAVCATLYEGSAWWANRTPAPATPTHADGGTPQATVTVPPVSTLPAESKEPATKAYTPASSTKVGRGQTLLGICTQKFGNCDFRLLLWIRALNPQLRDPDHIEAGETIQLPVLGTIQNAASRPKNVLN